MPPPKNGKAAALVAANSAGAAPVLPIVPLPGSDVNKRIYEGVTDDLSTIRSKLQNHRDRKSAGDKRRRVRRAIQTARLQESYARSRSLRPRGLQFVVVGRNVRAIGGRAG